MNRRRVVGFLVACLGAAGLATVVGLLVAHFHGSGEKTSVAYALWIGGALLVFLTGSSGSTSRMQGEAYHVVGGRFTASPAMPRTPLALLLVGVVLVGIGVLVQLYG